MDERLPGCEKGGVDGVNAGSGTDKALMTGCSAHLGDAVLG